MNYFYRKLFKMICKANSHGSKTVPVQYQSTRYNKLKLESSSWKLIQEIKELYQIQVCDE